MLKMKELKSNVGQTAYLYYSMWMKAYNRKVPDIETFATSKFYRSFVNFAEFAKKMGIANVEKFIKLMKEKENFTPIVGFTHLWPLMKTENLQKFPNWNQKQNWKSKDLPLQKEEKNYH